jgi:alpha-galactosidase
MAEIGFSQAGLASFAGPGHWNDPDMLEVGNGGMNTDEYRTHISLWAILAAPLLAGNDLAAMTPETVALLTNRDVIAIDQDKAGKQGDRVWAEGPVEVWIRPLADGSKAVGIFNRHPGPLSPKINLANLRLAGKKAHDVWEARDVKLSSTYSAKIPGHGVVLLRVAK